MNNQIIISIGREYGSGGLCIAEILAEKYNIPFYAGNILDIIAEEKGMNIDELQRFDEMPKNVFLSRTVSGFSNSPQDIVTKMTFDFLKERAENGESFIVVGRCGNSILKDNPNLIRIFVTSNLEKKIERVKSIYSVTDKEAEKLIAVNNRKRKAFHNYYCKERWGDSRYYDLTISTAKIGYEKASDVIDKFITSHNV